jgi:short-chain fatty acids transporter
MSSSNKNEMKNEKGMAAFAQKFSRFCNKWVPSAMVFVMMLTIIVAILAVIISKSPVITSTADKTSVMDAWVQGFWKLLQFAMQMALIMVTGFVVASSPPIKKAIVKLASVPKSQTGAIIFIGIVSFCMWWIHWGFGMMAGILLGREILAQSKIKGYKIHKNALVGMTYTISCAAAGISIAAPLFAAGPGFLRSLVDENTASLIPNSLPLNETVLLPTVIFQNLFLATVAIIIIVLMAPKNEKDIVEITDEFKAEILNAGKEVKEIGNTPAEKINNSPILNIFIGGFGLFWSVKLLIAQGIVGISINNYNFIMLMIGILLHWTPDNFTNAVQEACKAIWGVVVQFPFYAGIFGIITYTGLNHSIANAFVSISNAHTFPYIAYLYSAALNFFVPSGGSKFIIEAPYIIPAALKVGASLPATLNAYSFGDLTTNLIQPFWALPILAMYKLKFKDILPYGFIVCVVALLINTFWMLLLY